MSDYPTLVRARLERYCSYVVRNFTANVANSLMDETLACCEDVGAWCEQLRERRPDLDPEIREVAARAEALWRRVRKLRESAGSR